MSAERRQYLRNLPLRIGTTPLKHAPDYEAWLVEAMNRGINDEFWARMFDQYSQEEVVELTMCLGSWLAFGRLNHVFGLDAACTIPTDAVRVGNPDRA